jgi:excisionase family DNA binding protein
MIATVPPARPETSHGTMRIMRYTLGTAAKAVGVGKATISRAIASGKLSAERRPGGTFAIDASELYRVFPPPPPPEQVPERTDTPETPPEIPLRNGANRTPLYGGQVAEALAREREQLLATIADLRQRLTESEQERRATAERLTALLTDQRTTPPSPARRSWWPWRRG